MSGKKNHKYSQFLHKVTFKNRVVTIEGRPLKTFFMILFFIVCSVALLGFFIQEGKTPLFILTILVGAILFMLYGAWDSFHSRSFLEYDIKTGHIKAFKRKASSQFFYKGPVSDVRISVFKRKRRVEHGSDILGGGMSHEGEAGVVSVGRRPMVSYSVELRFKYNEVTVFYPLSNFEKWEHTELDEFVEEWNKKLEISGNEGIK